MQLQEQLKVLENLQELDLKIRNLEIKKGGLPSELKTLKVSLLQKNTALEQAQKTVEEINKQHLQNVAALELNQDRLARANEKLEAVQNSNEFSAANKEVTQLNKFKEDLDRKSEETSKRLEEARAVVEKIQGEMAAIQADLDSKSGEVSSAAGELDGEIEKLMNERGAMTGDLKPQLVSKYDRIRKAREGVGLSPVSGGRCKSCNVMIPPQMNNLLHKAENMIACPSCQRILYLPQTADQEGDGASA